MRPIACALSAIVATCGVLIPTKSLQASVGVDAAPTESADTASSTASGVGPASLDTAPCWSSSSSWVVPYEFRAVALTVVGNLAKNSICESFRRHFNQIKYCIESSLVPTFDPGVETSFDTEVEGRFVIDKEGAVVDASVEVADEGADEALGKLAGCIEGRIKRWRFPATTPADDTQVVQRWVLRGSAVSNDRRSNIAFGPVKADGGLPKAGIEEVVQRGALGIFKCYQRALDEQEKSLAGKLSISFRVRPTGEVSDVVLSGEGLEDHADFVACATSRLGDWRFPTSRDGRATKVEQWMQLSPGWGKYRCGVRKVPTDPGRQRD